MANFPQRIICLTEESVEVLYALGKESSIIGVSAYVMRPPEARKLPKISVFTHANYKKILDYKPDLVLGFSDIQKEIAKELIGHGLNVFIANHRSLEEILNYILWLGALVGENDQAQILVKNLESKINFWKEKSALYNHLSRPKVYFEEWDEPMISGIRWVSELLTLCGAQDIGSPFSQGVLAKDRFISSDFIIEQNPDIILACWCGKKVDRESIKKRPGWEKIKAVQTDQIIELAPEIFLQPGLAPLQDGIDILDQIFKSWREIQRPI